MNVTGIILAGGKSERFGYDKTTLKLDGCLIIEKLANLSTQLFSEVLIVSNQANKFGLPNTREIADEFANMGPMAGIHAALKVAKNPYTFVMASDMPFVSKEIIELMLSRRFGHQVVLACSGKYMEPLFGVYKKDLYWQMEEMLKANQRCILDLYPKLNICYLDKEEWQNVDSQSNPFFNVNYMEDYLSLLNGKKNSKKQKSHKQYYLDFCNGLEEGDSYVAKK